MPFVFCTNVYPHMNADDPLVMPTINWGSDDLEPNRDKAPHQDPEGIVGNSQPESERPNLMPEIDWPK